MLFLAVFCGFLAENLREHYVEHQRARQYAILLYADIKEDTWVRDGGRCLKCGRQENLEFDHIIPISKGIICEVKFLELDFAGEMRHASFKGLID